MNILYVVSILIAVFILGAVGAVMWRYFGRHEHTTQRRLNLVLGFFFTIVALLVTGELIGLTVQFSSYVNTTIRRDKAQEDCLLSTVDALRFWAFARLEQQEAAHDRDLALRPLLEELQRGGRVEQSTADDVVKAFAEVETARKHAQKTFADHPVPECKLEPGQ